MFPEEEKQIRIKSRETVKRYFPAQTAKIQASYGLEIFSDTLTEEQIAYLASWQEGTRSEMAPA